jgi:protein-S-isoprenylcysteine O-methyltransferase Ste14
MDIKFTFARRRIMSDSPQGSAATRESGAAVRVPAPPLLFAAPLAATLALQKWLPLPLPGRPLTTALGAVLTIAGLAFSGSGAATFRRNGTTVVPQHPVSTLVTEGPYRISRNPMYTGLAAAYVGAALWVGTWWPLTIAPLPVLATRRWVIAPEEEYLKRRFGAEYERYQSQVRRWL